MTRHVTQDDFDRYVTTDEGLNYLKSEMFERKCNELFARLDAGEEYPAEWVAEFLDLPWPVFRHLFGHYLAMVHMLAGAEPISRSVH
jgi:hypothetical protein